ncbi:acriflavin resistance protein [Desulfocucumis palustris]|uniref:Acriflavin resistance protein n=1 Tax=Desulfocucumis palustris TaxID=1898651 RepID=A0A2L2XC46_9FIRM|nr:acriflavin resistance protein [Desulfocucumis palustris]
MWPILSTSATTVFGLLPMVILGSSLNRPIAISIISGVVFSTVLTLILVPNVYLLVESMSRKKAI